MGALEQTIEKAIKEVSEKFQIKHILTGTAKDVGTTTCTVERDNAPSIHDVRLNAIDDDLQSYFTVYPAEGSSVIVAIIENLKTEAVLLHCSEISKVSIKIGSQTFVMNKDGFVFNDGEKGIPKLKELEDNLKSLKEYVEAINTALPSAFTAVGSSTAASGSAGSSSYSASMLGKVITLKDMENTKIKQ